MGQGLYNRLAWGIINPPSLPNEDDEWTDIVDPKYKLRPCSSYESETPYLAIPICTDSGAGDNDEEMPDRYAVPFTDLLAKLTGDGAIIEAAKAKWEQVRAVALEKTGILLDYGQLIWINDYD